MDVEVGVSGGLGGVEAVLVLGGCCPGGVGGRCGHHHEERLEAGFVLEEFQGHVGLRKREGKPNVASKLKFEVVQFGNGEMDGLVDGKLF